MPGHGAAVQVWDLVGARRRPNLTGLKGEVRSIVVSADGSWLAASDRRRMTWVWDVATSEKLMSVKGSAELVLGDNSRLVTTLKDEITVWDVRCGTEVTRFRCGADVLCNLVAAPDGSWLATIDDDHVVRVWESTTGVCRLRFAIDSLPLRVSAGPDGGWLAMVSRDHVVRVWDATTGEERAAVALPPTSSAPAVVDPDGLWAATVCKDRTLQIWEIASGQLRAMMRCEDDVYECAWVPHGRLLAVGGHAGLYLFDFDPGS